MNLPHNNTDKTQLRLAQLFTKLEAQTLQRDAWADEHAEILAQGRAHEENCAELRKQIEQLGAAVCLDAAAKGLASPTLGAIDLADGSRLLCHTSVSRLRAVDIKALYADHPKVFGVPGVASVSAKALEEAVLQQLADQKALACIHQAGLRPAFRWRRETD